MNDAERKVTRQFFAGKITKEQYHKRLRNIGTRRHALKMKKRKWFN